MIDRICLQVLVSGGIVRIFCFTFPGKSVVFINSSPVYSCPDTVCSYGGDASYRNSLVNSLVCNQFFLVVAVTNPPKYSFNLCKSATCKFLFRDTKSARDKNGTKPRKNKIKNTLPEISLVEYLCFVCKGTNLSLEKRGEIPISLIHNSFSYHCTPNVVIASDFDLKQHDLRKSGVKFCFAL